MHIFVVAARKGGAGKSTSSRNIGVDLASRGYSVVLVDTDPMLGLTKWWNRRESAQPPLLDTTPARLPLALEQLRAAGVDFVIIDTPPQATKIVSDTVALADLVIVPSKASPDDLDPIGETVDLVEAQGKPMVFVLNEVRPKSRIESQAVLMLSQHGKVAPIVHYRQEMVNASITGRTVQETHPKSKGAAEVRALSDYLLKQVGIDVRK